MSQTRTILLQRDVPSQRSELQMLPRMLEEIRSRCSIADDQFHNLVIALTEAVNNAIVHGNKSNPDLHVRYVVECDASSIHCVVEDEGEGFDLDDIADPISPENLLRAGGRGIFIIRALMRDVHAERTGRGMRIEFTCDRSEG